MQIFKWIAVAAVKAFVPLALIAGVLVLLIGTGMSQECQFKFCRYSQVTGPTTQVITNEARQRLGDLYNPGHGRRTQIRNNSQQILGYIEADGTITNIHRQRVGNIEQLLK